MNSQQKPPQRFQRTRNSKPGIPEGAVYVGRPTVWGNPAKIGRWYEIPEDLPDYILNTRGRRQVFVKDNSMAVVCFYEYCIDRAIRDPYEFASWLRPLLGRDLCCWCSPDQPCHADVLIWFANHIFYRPCEPGKNNVREMLVVPVKWPTLAEILVSKPDG